MASVIERDPFPGDDVHVLGYSPEWHMDYYARNDAWGWTTRRANGTIESVDFENEEVDIILDIGEYMNLELQLFRKYEHPIPGEPGMWLVHLT